MAKEIDNVATIVKQNKQILDGVGAINRSITSLATTIGQMRPQEPPQPVKAVCYLSEEDSASIKEVKSFLSVTKLSNEKKVKEMQKKRIVIQGTLLQKLFAILSGTLLLEAIAAVVLFINSPAYLAGRLYKIKSQEDIRNPGWYYHDAYSRIKAGERKFVKSEIKLAEMNLRVHQKAAAILEPLLDKRPIFVHHVERDPNQPEALVTFRYKDNDVIWKAYFSPDGAVYVTNSENVKVLYDAQKYLTSRKVKWEKVRCSQICGTD